MLVGTPSNTITCTVKSADMHENPADIQNLPDIYVAMKTRYHFIPCKLQHVNKYHDILWSIILK
jgi:hypothetical protein